MSSNKVANKDFFMKQIHIFLFADSAKVFPGLIRVLLGKDYFRDLLKRCASVYRNGYAYHLQNRLDKVGEALLECFPRTSSRLERMAQ